MDPQWKTYHSRMQSLERELAEHHSRFNDVGARNDTHSAKLRTLEKQLEDLKFDNSRLYNEVNTLRTNEPSDQNRGIYQPDKLSDNYRRDWPAERYHNYPQDTYRSGPYTDRYPLEREIPQQRNYDTNRPEDAQTKKDLERIEMHEGNFKPYASNFYQDRLRDQHRQREQNLEFDTSAHPIPPAHIDYKSTGNLEVPPKPASGVYMFIRTHKDALADVRKSFQRHKTTLNQSGHLTGIALPDKIRVTGDFNNWQLRRASWMEDRTRSISEYQTDYIMIVLWFPSKKAAENWVAYDQDFKIASFPEPYGADLIIVPVNYIPPEDAACSTFLVTEYPEVRQPEYFRTNIIEPMSDILKSYKCEPFVVRTTGVASVRGSWLGHKSTVAVHRFSSDTEAQKFYHDPRAINLRGKLNGVTHGGRHTTVRFTVEPF